MTPEAAELIKRLADPLKFGGDPYLVVPPVGRARKLVPNRSPHRERMLENFQLYGKLGRRVWPTLRAVMRRVSPAGITPEVRLAPRFGGLLDRLSEEIENPVDDVVVYLPSGSVPKIVLELVDEGGSPVGYVKVARAARARDLVAAEAENLACLQNANLEAIDLPVVVSNFEHQGCLMLVSVPQEQAWSDAPLGYDECYIGALCELFAVTRIDVDAGAVSHRYGNLLETRKRYTLSAWRRRVEQVIQRLPDVLSAGSAFGFMHGDFARWNVRSIDDRLYVFDWEHGDSAMLPGHDLIHLWLQHERLVEKRSVSHAWRTWSDNRSSISQAVQSYADKLSLDSEQRNGWLMGYLAEIATRTALELAEGDASPSEIDVAISFWGSLLDLALDRS